MEHKNWIDLSSFGAQFKRLNLPNNTSIPIVIINDVATFNSKALHLENFKEGAPDGVPFNKLPGNKKGREFNQPILYMTKSFRSEGDAAYSILPSLAKLLNVSLEEMKLLRQRMPVSEMESDIPYADLEKFNSIVDGCYSAYSGNTLYAVKNPTPHSNLVDYAEHISQEQHGLFPKANVANIPFETLDKMGVNTSIIGRAFLNPNDAKKSGYNINDLTRIHLEGEMSVLPISINNDLSINYISNVSEVSQLAYSNFKWRDNIGMINDLNALLAVQEASRLILNTAASAVQTPDQMNNLIQNISVTLQNYNESNDISKTHKAIKYFNKGVTTHVIQNQAGEWRYIEKDGAKKLDAPLTWENYQKALTTIANYNAILGSALQMKVKHGAEFDSALNKVFENHRQFYKNHVQVVESLDNAQPNGKVLVNTQGGKVHKNHLTKEINNFNRDMGQTLYTESVKQMLSGMRSVEDAGNIKNVVGAVIDEFSIQNNAQTIGEDPVDNDIGLSMLDKLTQGGSTALVKEIKIGKLETIQTGAHADFIELPRGISDAIDANYADANDTYKTLQHLELSKIPYYRGMHTEVTDQIAALSGQMNKQIGSSYEDYLKHGDKVFGESSEGTANEVNAKIEALRETAEQYNEIIDHSKIQSNILRYQFGKILKDLDQPVHSLLALKSDLQGNYVPFADASESRTAEKLVQNAFAEQNIDGFVELKSELTAKLDAFVLEHYAATTVDPSEPNSSLEAISKSIDKVQVFAMPVIESIDPLYITDKQANDLHTDIVQHVNFGLKKYAEGMKGFESLDGALSAVARHAKNMTITTGVPFKPSNNPEFNEIIKAFEAYDGSLSYLTPAAYSNPMNGVVIGDMTKLEILKAIADKSLSHLDKSDFIISDLVDQYGSNLVESRLIARENIESVTGQALSQKIAGQFLVNYQSSFKARELPSNEVFFYKVDGSNESFRVKSANAAELPEGAVSLSNANTFNVAVRESFVAYQVQQAASDLGISAATLAKIDAISNHVKNGDLAKVDELALAAYGHELSGDDLMSLKLVGAADKHDIHGNKLVLMSANDAGEFYLTHDDSQKLLDKVALTNKLAGIESAFRENPLIANIGDTAEFDRVQKYLMPELEEHASIATIIRSAENAGGLSQELAEKISKYSITAYKNGLAQDILINPQDVTLVTNLPSSEKDIAFSRVVPGEWNLPFNNQSGRDFNFTDIRDPKGSLDIDAIKGHVFDHIEYGSYVGTRPSSPVIAKVNSCKPETIKLTEAENAALNNASLVVGGSAKDIHAFEMAYAANNLQVALNNLPSDLLEQYHSSLNGNVHPSNVRIRVSMTQQDGLSLPQVRFESFNSEMPANQKFMCSFDASDLKKLLTEGGFDHTKLGVNSVVLEPNEKAHNFNTIFLERSGFKLDEYLAHASEKLGIELKAEDPKLHLDKIAPISFDEQQLSAGLLKSNIAIIKGMLSAYDIADQDAVINSAKVFLKNGEEQVSMAVAYTEDKCREYLADGYLAVSSPYSAEHSPADGYNILRTLQRQVRTPDDVELVNSLTTRFFDVVDQPLKQTENNDVVLTAPITESEIEAISELAGKELSIQDAYVPVERNTKFADELKAFTFAEIEQMRTSELAENIQLNKIWPQSPLEAHIASNHQNLDTMMLSRVLRSSIVCEQPFVRDGSTLEKEATAYNFFLAEMHGAVNKSRTPEELLSNYDKAYMNVVNLHPEFFSKSTDNADLNTQNDVLNAFKKSSFAFINGADASTALSQGFLTNSNAMDKYNDVALDVGSAEKLYSAEKPFLSYMNGFTINAKDNALDWVNDRLMSRLADVRQSSIEDMSAYETPNTVVHHHIVNTIQARTAMDFDAQQDAVNLNAKWGVNFSVAEGDSHFAQGYSKVTDGLLSKLQESFDGKLSSAEIGRNMEIQAGSPYRLESGKDLYITDLAGGVDGNYKHFANRYLNRSIKLIERAEVEKMTPAEISQFSAVKEEHRGLVAMVEKYGYEPKTQAGNALLSVHHSLINGQGDGNTGNAVQSLIEHSQLVVSRKRGAIEKNAIQFTADHSGEYAKHYVSYMESRQDAGLKNLSEKMRKIQAANPGATDLYHFTPAIDMLDKISNTASISSKSAVDKFMDEFNGSKDKANRELTLVTLNAAIAEKTDSILAAQDYLASRAADKFIQLLDQYAPEEMKGNQHFLENIEQYFGSRLGDNAQFTPAQYASDYGHAQEVEHNKEFNLDPEYTSREINKDRVVYNYLNAVMDHTESEFVSRSERELGMGLMTNVLASHYADLNSGVSADLTKDKALRADSSMDYEG